MADTATTGATSPSNPALAALRALGTGLTGPFLDKELRVASRHVRTYVLRTVYVVGLAVIIAITFSFTVTAPTSAATSRAAEAARMLSVAIAWFQFVAAQLMAVAMLGNTVGEELRVRTLDVLLATPLSGAQFVLGKFLSRLLQILLTVALGLPVMGAMRIFGGVPWDFLLVSTGITFGAILVAGALALCCSVRMQRRRRMPTVLAAGILMAWHGATAALLLWGGMGTGATSFASLVNPFCALLVQTTARVLTPGSGPSASGWPYHVALMIGVSTVLLAATALGARRTLERRVFVPEGCARPVRREGLRDSPELRDVSPCPIYWRDVHARKLRPTTGPLHASEIGGLCACVALALALLVLLTHAFLPNIPLCVSQVLFLFAVMRTAVMAASAIAREKEDRTWALILATPLDSWAIVAEKALAVLRRNLILWLAVIVTGIPACSSTYFHDDEELLTASFNISEPLFVIGAGLYLSARCRTSTAATVWMLGVTLGQLLGTLLLATLLGPALGMYPHDDTGFGALLTVLLNLGLGLLFLRAAAHTLRTRAS